MLRKCSRWWWRVQVYRPSDTYIDHWPPLEIFSSLRVLGPFQAKWQRQWQNCGHSGWLHLDSFSNNSLPKMWNYDPRARAAGGFSLGPQSSVKKNTFSINLEDSLDILNIIFLGVFQYMSACALCERKDPSSLISLPCDSFHENEPNCPQHYD